LDGPEFFPGQKIVSLETATTRRDTDEARFSSTWDDISNNQFVELSNDGGNNFIRFTNSSSGTATFAGEETDIDTNLALSRWGSTTGQTPLTGINGQSVDVWDLFASIVAISTDGIGEALARAVVSPGTITGQNIAEAGMFGSGDLLTHHTVAEFTVESQQRLASAETSVFTGDD